MSRLLALFTVLGLAASAATPQPHSFQQPLAFEPNRGQAPATVKWIARAAGYRLLLTEAGATIVLSANRDSDPRCAWLGALLADR